MKNLTHIINEASEISYRVSLADVLDKKGLPMDVTISIERSQQTNFEEWLEEQEGNLFLHAAGGTVEY
jgi:hypothetical protein